MAESTDNPRSPGVEEFLRKYREDEESGEARSLAEYLAECSSDHDDIAREYLALRAGTVPGDRKEEIRRRIAADHADGRTLTLIAYRAMFPGYDDEVRQAFDEVMSPPDTETGTGEAVGPYHLVRELGRGGQGIVYLAQDVRLQRHVALKVLTHGVRSQREMLRFQREAEIASRLDDPGICQVYDVGESDGQPYIAMRFVEGESLARRISVSRDTTAGVPTSMVIFDATTTDMGRGGEPRDPAAPLEEETDLPSGSIETDAMHVAAHLVERVARSLHKAHDVGIIHRDIKPANIIVAAGGDPVILDFGLATDTQSDAVDLTITGELVGTPAYMSPEQVAAKRIALDRRTDVYSLGVTLYECLTLQRPFRAATRSALYQEIVSKEPESVRRLNRSVPRDLAVIVETAMAKNRDDRYRTAEELAEDLRRYRQRKPIKARPAGPVLRLWRWAQRRPMVASLTGALFVVLTTSVIVLTGLNRQSEARRKQAEEARADADTQRESVLRLSDLRKLDEYRLESDRLWPARERQRADLAGLRDRITALLASEPTHRHTLAALRERGTPVAAPTDDDWRPHRSLVERLARRRTSLVRAWKAAATPFERREEKLAVEALLARHDEVTVRVREDLAPHRFEAARDRWQHALLAELAAELRLLVEPDGLLTSVRARLARAERIEEETIEAWSGAWREAARLARRGPYAGQDIDLDPIPGLIPLGADPDTGLVEFLHWESHHGTVPERDENDELPRVGWDTGIILVLIPGARTAVGGQKTSPELPRYDRWISKNETPPVPVILDPFFIAKREVTQRQWRRLTGSNPSVYAPGDTPAGTTAAGFREISGMHPVEGLSWDECRRQLPRYGLRLPTDAQWEHACRAGSATVWSCGDEPTDLKGYANFADVGSRDHFAEGIPLAPFDDGHATHAPVGSFEPNEFGLFDMHGNVGEFCADRLEPLDTATFRPGDGLIEGRETAPVIVRGGSFVEPPQGGRSATRGATRPDSSTQNQGVRPAMLLPRD